MKITNKLNLPQPIVNAVANDPYPHGGGGGGEGGGWDISVTALLSPPRKTALEITHRDDLEEDASDRIWSLLGQSIHAILERSSSTQIAERRLSIMVEGWRVSGGMDLYSPGQGLLQDYKITTAWKFKSGEVSPDFERQLNMYAEILRQNGEPVNKLQIVGILRDWSKLEAARDPEYPQSQVIVVDVNLWPATQAQAYLKERVILHKQARISLPECDENERWQKPTTYAVMKPGAKRSLKNYTSLVDAQNHVDSTPGLVIEKRPGSSTRCQYYCSVANFCDQYKAMKKESV